MESEIIIGNILQSIKKLLGIDSSDYSFDEDVIMCINACFSTLNQLGVGPEEGFVITGTENWSDFIGLDKRIENVKTYVFLKTRLMFDPPQNSFLVDSIEKQILELEWRLNVVCDK